MTSLASNEEVVSWDPLTLDLYFKPTPGKKNSASPKTPGIKGWLVTSESSFHWLPSFSQVCWSLSFLTPACSRLFFLVDCLILSRGWLWTEATYLLRYNDIFMQKKSFMEFFHLKWICIDSLVFLEWCPLENVEGNGGIFRRCNYENNLSSGNKDKCTTLAMCHLPQLV